MLSIALAKVTMRGALTSLALAPLALAPLALAEQAAEPEITMDNGEQNWIVLDGATREGATLTFSEVTIEGDGWLVMHPFEDGKPNGNIYVGHTFVSSGKNQNVEITVDEEPDTGDMFIVMLHSDVDQDQEFDFVFVNDREVEDKAVFEGTKMIGHAYAVP